MWFMANIRLILAGAALISAFGLGWYVESQLAESRLKEALAGLEKALVAQCTADKKITEDSSNAYQKKLADANRRLNDLKRLYSNTPIPLSAGEASRPHAATGGINAGQNGIAPAALFEYAAECETYRLNTIGLQDFINKTWER